MAIVKWEMPRYRSDSSIRRVVVERETEKCVWITSWYSDKVHREMKKSRPTLYDTFEEAKAALIQRLEAETTALNARLRSIGNELSSVRSLTEPKEDA